MIIENQELKVSAYFIISLGGERRYEFRVLDKLNYDYQICHGVLKTLQSYKATEQDITKAVNKDMYQFNSLNSIQLKMPEYEYRKIALKNLTNEAKCSEV